MVNYYVYAKDFSGSTSGVKFYHDNGLKSLQEFKCDIEKIEKQLLAAGETPAKSKVVYLHWNDHCVEVDERYTKKSYENLKSDWRGTYPETIISYLKKTYTFNENDKIKLLYIITDGLIGSSSANRCFKDNEDMFYETVVFHAFNQNLNEIDISVAASFFKSQCIVYRNYELYDNTDISQEFDYDKINLNNFEAAKDELKSYIRLKFIRKCKQDRNALKEIDKLKNLRKRLFEELSSKENSAKTALNLETKDRNEFINSFVSTDWYKNLNGQVNIEKADIEKSITTLINYIVSDSKSYSFDALKLEKKFNHTVEEEQVEDIHFAAEEEIEFPDVILMDDKGIPVVILTDFDLMEKIIFHQTRSSDQSITPASFSKFKTNMDCPLFLIKDEDISDSIGYFYTLNVYKQLLASETNTDPRTRKPFHGGLVLTSTNQFDKYNDYILSATYFNGKKVNYNVGLFYYVLWKNCENKEWMDKNVVEQFKKYAMRRISETVCKIGLSSLPLDPQENTSLLSALWYCVELSSVIFKDDIQNFEHERLRMYYGVAHYMIEILELFDYDLDLASIKKRIDLLRHVMILKKIQKKKEKVYYLLEKIFKTVDGFLVSEIEKPYNLDKLNYLKFNHKEILCDDVVKEEVHLNDYIHVMHLGGDLETSKAGIIPFKISEKTYRPIFALDRNKSFYTELVQNTKKVVIKNDHDKDKIEIAYEPIDSLEFDRILSPYKLFIDCVKDADKYPTFDEYVEYVSRKKKFNEELVTIFPTNVYFDIKNVYERYQEIVKNVEIKQFIKTCDSCVSRVERIKAEENVTFSDDKEIMAFITSEESKVNLKRKIHQPMSKKALAKSKKQ